MNEIQFPPYSVVPNPVALESRRAIPDKLQIILGEIELSLCNDPSQAEHPERVAPISTSGKNFIYTYPDPEIQVTYEVDEESKRLLFFHYSAPAFKAPKSIFISYSHKNKDMLDDLKIALATLEELGMIKYWDDSKRGPRDPVGYSSARACTPGHPFRLGPAVHRDSRAGRGALAPGKMCGAGKARAREPRPR